MKSSISITIDRQILAELKRMFPQENRSRVIEQAVVAWLTKEKKQRLQEAGLLVKELMKERGAIEEETLTDGLHEV